MTNFPYVTIEVSGGVAELTERSACVEVTIVDHDNEAIGASEEESRDFYPALYDDEDYWALSYRGGEMYALVPRALAATENDAISLVKREHAGVIVIPQVWYTHDDMWEEVEL